MNTSKYFGLVLVCAVLFLGACSALPSGEVNGETKPGENTIQVVGVGQVQGTPDIASIQMGINLVDSDLEALIAKGNENIQKVTEQLLAAGIEPNDIRTTNYGIWPEEIFDRMTGEQTGERRYHADLTLDVTIRAIDRMSEIIQVGLDAGVNNIYGINFGLDDRIQLETQARSEAISDAEVRAKQLADGLGMSVGKALSISEGVIGAPYAPGFMRVEGIGGGGGSPVSPGQSAVTIEVVIVFELIE